MTQPQATTPYALGSRYRLTLDDRLTEMLAEADRAAGKSAMLLQEWLSPEQLEQYEMTGKFAVTGSHTKARYWIADGSKSHNVVRIDPKRKIGTERLCFVPQGASAPGDVMLAQKIMLETDEPQALKIANRYRVTIDGRW